MNAGKSAAIAQKQTIDWQRIQRDWAEYFENEAPDNWREIFIPLLIGTMTDQTEMLNAEFGMSFDVHNWLGEVFAGTTERAQWWNRYADVFGADIARDTNEQMGKLIYQALNNGWTIGETTKQIQAEFQRYVELGFEPRNLTDEEIAWFTERLPQYRAENIARTETIKAANAGSTELYRAWGVRQKEWYATADNRTREAHRVGAAWGKEPLVSDIDGTFEIGGERLAYPGDPNGSPANICQCRCTVLPVIED